MTAKVLLIELNLSVQSTCNESQSKVLVALAIMKGWLYASVYVYSLLNKVLLIGQAQLAYMHIMFAVLHFSYKQKFTCGG